MGEQPTMKISELTVKQTALIIKEALIGGIVFGVIGGMAITGFMAALLVVMNAAAITAGYEYTASISEQLKMLEWMYFASFYGLGIVGIVGGAKEQWEKLQPQQEEKDAGREKEEVELVGQDDDNIDMSKYQ